MPKKQPAFSGPTGYSEAYQYLVSVGIEPPRKGKKSTQENHEKQVIREARKAKEDEELGFLPEKGAGRGAHRGEKAPEKGTLRILKQKASGWHREQVIMFNNPISDPTREIGPRDIEKLYKAAGRPRYVSIVVTGTAKQLSPELGEPLPEELEDVPCEPASLTAHTDRSTIEAVIKRKMDIMTFVNDLLAYGGTSYMVNGRMVYTDAKKHTWCTIDSIAMYETPVYVATADQKKGTRKKRRR